ncbi:MAG: CotH kinase family protein [Flavobacteriales bacterium]
MFRFLFFAVVVILSGMAFAQQALPPFGSAFRQDLVATIRITIHPDTLALLLHPDNWGNERMFPAQFQYQAGQSNQIIQQVGFRLRGNTSMAAQKKPFKVSFNTYVPGAKWNGLEKLNLNAHHNDPAHFRAKLCWDLIRDAGLPGSRTSFVRLFINNEYRGLYTNVEHIDEEFVKRYFDGTGRGNLYKCLYPAPLQFISNNPDAYKFVAGNRRAYEQKINDFADDYRDLEEFIRILNQTSADDFECELEKVFNVDRYLRYLALDILTGNWDGYNYNQNNFYLYKNQLTGQFEYIPYDLDNTFGIDWFNINWTSRNIYNWAPSNAARPLYERIIASPKFRQRFSNYMHEYLLSVFTIENITQKIDQYMAFITQPMLEDTYRTLDYGFDDQAYLQSPTEAFGLHVKSGVIPFAIDRFMAAAQQLDFFNPTPSIEKMWVIHDLPVSIGANVFTQIKSQFTLPNLQASVDRENWVDVGQMQDDGIAPDQLAGDGIYSIALSNNWQESTLDKVYLRIQLVENNQEVYLPCQGQTLHLSRASDGIFINELMADNINFIQDEQGHFDDWIEIWNENDIAINLKDYYITDNPLRPDKFLLPDTLLPAGGFFLLWADNDPFHKRNHANFALAKAGEELRLYKKEDRSLRLSDRIVFPDQNSNHSYGRQVDGSPTWINFTSPTPNASNQTTIVADAYFQSFVVFPNPTSDRLYFNQSAKLVQLRNMQGQVLLKAQNIEMLDLQELSLGIYILEIDGSYVKVVKQ